MIFKVFEERATKEKPEPEVCLRLLDDGDGEVTVVVCGKDGKRVIHGSICRFMRNGTLFLNSSINHDLGFAVDDNGRIIIVR